MSSPGSSCLLWHCDGFYLAVSDWQRSPRRGIWVREVKLQQACGGLAYLIQGPGSWKGKISLPVQKATSQFHFSPFEGLHTMFLRDTRRKFSSGTRFGLQRKVITKENFNTQWRKLNFLIQSERFPSMHTVKNIYLKHSLFISVCVLENKAQSCDQLWWIDCVWPADWGCWSDVKHCPDRNYSGHEDPKIHALYEPDICNSVSRWGVAHQYNWIQICIKLL